MKELMQARALVAAMRAGARAAVVLAGLQAAAGAQVSVTFLPQQSPFAGITRYEIVACTEQAATVTGGRVYVAAASQIDPVLPAAMQEKMGAATKTAWQRKVLLGLEYASWGVGVAAAGSAIKIKEPGWQVFFPAAAAVLRTATTAWKKEVPGFQMPGDLLPSLFQIPANGCAQYSVFARTKADEKPFTVEVDAKVEEK